MNKPISGGIWNTGSTFLSVSLGFHVKAPIRHKANKYFTALHLISHQMNHGLRRRGECLQGVIRDWLRQRVGFQRGLAASPTPTPAAVSSAARSLAGQLGTRAGNVWSLSLLSWKMGTLVTAREQTEGGLTLGTGVWSSHYQQCQVPGLSRPCPGVAPTAGSCTGCRTQSIIGKDRDRVAFKGTTSS